MSLRESAASGDRLAALRDLRDLLAGQIETCESLRDMAALTARFTDVLSQIEAVVPPVAEVDEVDEIAARRASRGSSTATG